MQLQPDAGGWCRARIPDEAKPDGIGAAPRISSTHAAVRLWFSFLLGEERAPTPGTLVQAPNSIRLTGVKHSIMPRATS
jgi:hypothetical protein